MHNDACLIALCHFVIIQKLFWILRPVLKCKNTFCHFSFFEISLGCFSLSQNTFRIFAKHFAHFPHSPVSKITLHTFPIRHFPKTLCALFPFVSFPKHFAAFSHLSVSRRTLRSFPIRSVSQNFSRNKHRIFFCPGRTKSGKIDYFSFWKVL